MWNGNRKKSSNTLVIVILMTIILAFCNRGYFSQEVYASDVIPYDSYSYDYYGDVKYTPAPYIPVKSISEDNWDISGLNRPQDMCVSDNGKIYIADTGNNRIIETDNRFNLIKIIETYEYNGQTCNFNAPTGLCYTEDEILYVADTGNYRVVALNESGSLHHIIENPESEVLGDYFQFEPMKVSVDYANRVYVIAKNMYQGIMAFDSEGSFRGFTGKIEVKISTYEKIWRKLTTKAQRNKQQLFIPTEFTGMEIDENGFIYATNMDSLGKQAIRRLNPKGEDVIKKGPRDAIAGDLSWRWNGDYSGASRIVDVVVRDKGIYSLIDSLRGRIFTYDHEGNLLYIFGGIGSQVGTFTSPVAIERMGDNILVLDSFKNSITVFKPTQYGELINKAVGLRYDGDEKEAVYYWEEVLKLDSNYELAYLGLGKSYLTWDDNGTAMKYFALAKNQQYYSIAYKRLRNEFLRGNLEYLLTLLIIVIVGLIIFKSGRKKKRLNNER